MKEKSTPIIQMRFPQKVFFCETDVSFLSTEKNNAQLTHVDYPWMYLKQEINKLRESNFVKSIISIFPLTEEGMMINFWLNNDQSKGRVMSKLRDGEEVEMPYKLIVEHG